MNDRAPTRAGSLGPPVQPGAASGTARQGGLDVMDQVVAPRRKDQQGLGEWIHRFMQNQLAHGFSQRRAARLARDHHGMAALAQPDRQALDVGALARAVDALQGDEAAGFHRPPR